MRIIAAWARLDGQRRWRSLAALALLVALATATVLTAAAGARRGQTAFGRLWARTLPATVTVLPNQPGFDWSRIRALSEVSALTTFAVARFALDGYPLATQSPGLPPADSQVFRTIERPVVLQGRLLNPGRVDEVDVTPLFPANYGKGVGDTLTLQLPNLQQGQYYDPTSGQPEGDQARGLVFEDPVDRVTEGGEVVPYVDVRAAGHPGEIGTGPGDRRGAAPEPHQRVDEAVVPDAHEVGAVVGQLRRRGDDATEGSGEIGEPG